MSEWLSKTPVKLIWHVFVFGLIALAILIGSHWVDSVNAYNAAERAKIIERYERHILQLEQINLKLVEQEKILIFKIDSISRIQTNVVATYDEKIKTVYSATAYQHAEWLDSIVKYQMVCLEK